MAIRYGSISTKIIMEQYVESYPYMVGCNMAVMLPKKHIDNINMSKGFFSPYTNEGAIIR